MFSPCNLTFLPCIQDTSIELVLFFEEFKQMSHTGFRWKGTFFLFFPLLCHSIAILPAMGRFTYIYIRTRTRPTSIELSICVRIQLPLLLLLFPSNRSCFFSALLSSNEYIFSGNASSRGDSVWRSGIITALKKEEELIVRDCHSISFSPCRSLSFLRTIAGLQKWK